MVRLKAVAEDRLHGIAALQTLDGGRQVRVSAKPFPVDSQVRKSAVQLALDVIGGAYGDEQRKRIRVGRLNRADSLRDVRGSTNLDCAGRSVLDEVHEALFEAEPMRMPVQTMRRWRKRRSTHCLTHGVARLFQHAHRRLLGKPLFFLHAPTLGTDRNPVVVGVDPGGQLSARAHASNNSRDCQPLTAFRPITAAQCGLFWRNLSVRESGRIHARFARFRPDSIWLRGQDLNLRPLGYEPESGSVFRAKQTLPANTASPTGLTILIIIVYCCVVLPPITFLLREVDRETWRQFKAACALRGLSLRQAILTLVSRVVAGEIDLDPATPKKKDKKS
jgi:hypothetical protein